MNDLSKTIAPKSDQLNADDLITGPITIKVTKVKAETSSEIQPVSINFEGDNGKPYKPCKSMRRVLVRIWGADGNAYAGRSMTLFLDPEVKFGGIAVGGIRISHMSGMKAEVILALTASKASRKPFRVQPLQVKEAAPDMLPVDKENIADIAMTEATTGGVAYVHWWKQQPRPVQAYLVESGEHEKCKVAAELFDNPPTTGDESVVDE
jgi:hypothetical protein